MRATILSFLMIRAIAIRRRCRQLLRAALSLAVGLGGVACQPPLETAPQPPIQQQWQLQPGTVIAERQVVGGLGDISIALNGGSVYAPFGGSLQPDGQGCAIFSSPDLPAYLARLCGLRRMRSGNLQAGDRIGSGQMLHFAALRKQPDGTWAMVEPSRDLLSRFLSP
ncbi:MAG: hypothetical protein ACFB4J_11195 [Elainellaceae cyanobacterium]